MNQAKAAHRHRATRCSQHSKEGLCLGVLELGLGEVFLDEFPVDEVLQELVDELDSAVLVVNIVCRSRVVVRELRTKKR